MLQIILLPPPPTPMWTFWTRMFSYKNRCRYKHFPSITQTNHFRGQLKVNRNNPEKGFSSIAIKQLIKKMVPNLRPPRTPPQKNNYQKAKSNRLIC